MSGKFRVDVLTIFPQAINCLASFGAVKRALRRNLIELNVVNFRDYCLDKHKQVDDTVYGTGDGMLIKVEPIVRALEDLGVVSPSKDRSYWRVLMGPKGTVLNNSVARDLAKFRRLVVICGHYEGIDDRIRSYIDEEISVGDFILSSGELAAMVLIDAVVRFLPSVIAGESLRDESFQDGLLEGPQWTRPYEFRGQRVPDILRSGDHLKVKEFNLKGKLAFTLWKRPDLFKGIDLLKLKENTGFSLKKLEEIIYEAIWEGLPCRT